MGLRGSGGPVGVSKISKSKVSLHPPVGGGGGVDERGGAWLAPVSGCIVLGGDIPAMLGAWLGAVCPPSGGGGGVDDDNGGAWFAPLSMD